MSIWNLQTGHLWQCSFVASLKGQFTFVIYNFIYIYNYSYINYFWQERSALLATIIQSHFFRLFIRNQQSFCVLMQ